MFNNMQEFGHTNVFFVVYYGMQKSKKLDQPVKVKSGIFGISCV